MADDDRITPARGQYLALKRRYPDALLLYRMGDFYELFDDDAVVAARDLHITLTSREFGKGNRVAMAGIPHHALASYLRRLMAKGRRVAVCEQLSEPGHGLVERDVVRVLSPGTVAEPGLLAARENNYLVAVNPGRGGAGLAYVDVSTGEFAVTQFDTDDHAAFQAELARLAPAECLLPAPAVAAESVEPPHGSPWATPAELPRSHCPPRWFEPAAARERLLRHFGVVSLEPFGCEGVPLAIGAAAAVLSYIEGTNRELLRLLRGLHGYSTAAYVLLDPHTVRNLELTRTARGGDRAGSLLAALDHTRTPMGARLLRRWLSRPLRDLAAINLRLSAVEALVAGGDLRRRLIALLNQVGDLERLTGRARQGSASPRELLALAAGLRAAHQIAGGPAEEEDVEHVDRNQTATAVVAGVTASALAELLRRIDSVPELIELIEQAVADESGRMVRTGFDAELDELAGTISSAQRTLLGMEQRERERTGIRSLKISFNKVYGYYIEITKSNLRHVPADYTRRQTLATGERFITPELKEWEARILRAEERLGAREQEVYARVLERGGEFAGRLLATAATLSELDVLVCFAQLAESRRYVRPVVDQSGVTEITGGRHPVVELTLEDGAFVPNDTTLGLDAAVTPPSNDAGQVLLITGPNMAGKSTYLRQVVLITLLGQAGSFVPASRARLGVVDRIFTRVGAQDDLAAGASTFLVEMAETAAILRHATSRSLLVLDEIGRGTSTYDGLSIAQAVVEDVHDRIGARTLFATHFHELTALAERLPRLRNVNATAIEQAGSVVFLRRIAPGKADRSYGIHVARLAGLPGHVTERAAELLRQLEDTRPFGAADDAPPAAATLPVVRPLRSVAESPAAYRTAAATDCAGCATAGTVAAAVAEMNVAATTPIEAINLLFDLQQRLKSGPPCTCAPPVNRPAGAGADAVRSAAWTAAGDRPGSTERDTNAPSAIGPVPAATRRTARWSAPYRAGRDRQTPALELGERGSPAAGQDGHPAPERALRHGTGRPPRSSPVSFDSQDDPAARDPLSRPGSPPSEDQSSGGPP